MKPTFTNDKKAPRMKKAAFSIQIVTKQLHKEFIKAFPDYKHMKWDEFFQNWKDLAETIRQEAIYNPLGVKLGSYTGELKLQYLPYKFDAENKDYKLQEELGRKLDHVNLTTKGKVASIKWERRWAVKYNKMLQFYAFDETRELNKMANKRVTESPEELRVSNSITKGMNIWKQFKAHGNKKTTH